MSASEVFLSSRYINFLIIIIVIIESTGIGKMTLFIIQTKLKLNEINSPKMYPALAYNYVLSMEGWSKRNSVAECLRQTSSFIRKTAKSRFEPPLGDL